MVISTASVLYGNPLHQEKPKNKAKISTAVNNYYVNKVAPSAPVIYISGIIINYSGKIPEKFRNIIPTWNSGIPVIKSIYFSKSGILVFWILAPTLITEFEAISSKTVHFLNRFVQNAFTYEKKYRTFGQICDKTWWGGIWDGSYSYPILCTNRTVPEL